MKVGVFGVYSANSLGDHYLLDGIIKQFRDNAGEGIEFTIFSQSPNVTSEMLFYDVETLPAIPNAGGNRPQTTDKPQTAASAGHSFRWIKKRAKRFLDGHPNMWLFSDIYQIRDIMFWKDIYGKLKDLDILLLGGGNIVMDLYPYGCVHYLLYTTLAQCAGTPSMYYSIGAGPIQSKRAKLYYSRSIDDASSLTTRDQNSIKVIESKLATQSTSPVLSADPAVFLPSNFNTSENFAQTNSSIQTHLGVSVVPYYREGYWPVSDPERYSDYIEGMAEIISFQLDNDVDKATFFATNHPADLEPAEEIANHIDYEGKVDIYRGRPNSGDLITALNSFDRVLCTRLHSLIPTFVSNTPFVAYSYQPKVKEFCNRVGLPEQVVSLEKSSEDMVLDSRHALQNIRSWDGTIPEYSERLESIRQSSLISFKEAMGVIRDSL